MERLHIICLTVAILQVAEPLALKLDSRALNKKINADVSVQLPPWNGGGAQSVKFHHRPLYGQFSVDIDIRTMLAYYCTRFDVLLFP